MSRPLIPGAVDLGNGDNVVQARHELHRAIDFGGDVECAAWARKWGEAALACGERVRALDEDDYWPGASEVKNLIQRALSRSGDLQETLSVSEPNIDGVRSAANRVRYVLTQLEDLLENDE